MRNEIKHVREFVYVCARVCVCARTIIRSNLTYPIDDSMETSDGLKEKLCFLSPCLTQSLTLFLEIKENIYKEQEIV